MEVRIQRETDTKEKRTREVTRRDIEEGAIPSICPICKNPTDSLVIHHWWGEKHYAIEDGDYRRICSSCNGILGIIYQGNYPIRWEDQFAALGKYFGKFPGFYPNFGEEGWWSLFTRDEMVYIESGDEAERGLYDYKVVFPDWLEVGGRYKVQAKNYKDAVEKLGIIVKKGSGIRGPKPR